MKDCHRTNTTLACY